MTQAESPPLWQSADRQDVDLLRLWPKVVALVTAAFTAMGYTVSRGMAKRG